MDLYNSGEQQMIISCNRFLMSSSNRRSSVATVLHESQQQMSICWNGSCISYSNRKSYVAIDLNVEEAATTSTSNGSFEGYTIGGDGPTELISSFSEWIREGFLPKHAQIKEKEDRYSSEYSGLRIKQLDFVLIFPEKKDWFYLMAYPNNCWNDEDSEKSLSFDMVNVASTARQTSDSLDCGIFVVAYAE